MQCTYSNKDSHTTVTLSGKFTFADHVHFRGILDLAQHDAANSITLDFTAIEFIDSAGLGMLLLLRDACLKKNVSLSICGIQGQVQKIFAVAKFEQLFSIR